MSDAPFTTSWAASASRPMPPTSSTMLRPSPSDGTSSEDSTVRAARIVQNVKATNPTSSTTPSTWAIDRFQANTTNAAVVTSITGMSIRTTRPATVMAPSTAAMPSTSSTLAMFDPITLPTASSASPVDTA